MTPVTALLDSLAVPLHLRDFVPTRAAAQARLASVHPGQYARTRNALDGAVSGLSPYFTHGLLSLRDAATQVVHRHVLSFDDKLVAEWAWRAFYHHVWRHAADGGRAILSDLRSPPVWLGHYAEVVPADIREGRTGVAAIDAAVRTLYATGYLHNHARMWLASYVVHMRKVHWRAGADWLYGHLLDGDLASNHLSWQWVAGTFSIKPYLFNADNVARYAPAASAAWHSPDTVIDQSYEALEEIARHQGDVGPQAGSHPGVQEPSLMTQPASDVLRACGAETVPVLAQIAGRDVVLVHPWAIGMGLPPPVDQAAGGNPGPQRPLRLGVIHSPAHTAWPWSSRRWDFVLQAMAQTCDVLWAGDARQLDLRAAKSVRMAPVLQPGYQDMAQSMALPSGGSLPLEDAPLFAEPGMFCSSFSRYYAAVRKRAGSFDTLCALPRQETFF